MNVTIAHDDPESICTAPGWEAYLKRARASSRAQVPDVKNARYFAVVSVSDPSHASWVEAERWYDARTFALAYLGDDVFVSVASTPPHPDVDRFQLLWIGSPLDPQRPPTMLFRRVDGGGVTGWKDYRA